MRDFYSHGSALVRLAMILIGWLLVVTIVQAQATQTPSVPTSPATHAETAPIALTAILPTLDEEQRHVEWANRLLQGPDLVGPLRKALDEIASPVDTKLRTSTKQNLRDLPVMHLQSLARNWDVDARRLERWELQTRRALAPYSDSAILLAQRRAAWANARATGSLDHLPQVISERLDAVLAQMDASEAALSAALTQAFELTQQGNEVATRIQQGRSDVTSAIEDVDRRLLRIDAPPIWQMIKPGAEPSVSFANLERGLAIETEFALDYRAAGTGNQQALGVIQGALFLLILWLFVRSRQASRNASEPKRITRALRRPISTWVLLSMLCVLLLEPDAPLLVREFVLLIALVPMLRLIPSETFKALGAWPYLAITLYIVDRLGVAVVADAGLYRLHMLVLSVLALALTLWMLHRTQLTASTHRGRLLQRLMHPLAWTALGMLLIAVVCNVVGNVSMAEALTSGVIDSGYMALLLYTGVAACFGLFSALLSQPELAKRGFLTRHGPMLHRTLSRLLVLLASIGWLLYSLERFRVLRPLQNVVTTVLEFGINVGEVSFHLGDALVLAFSSWLAFWAARAVQQLLREELPGSARLPRGVGHSIASLSYYFVLLIGLLIALSAAGFKVGQLTLVLGALGVGIGFGLQNIVNNFVSGLILIFERPIQPGDIVDAAGASGTVREIGLRATKIRTSDGADVVVPNGVLIGGNLANWTMFDRNRRFEIPVGVAYGSDPAQIIALLTATVRATPGVSETPAPSVQMTGYGDNALSFVVRVWTNDISTLGSVQSDLLARILAALQAEGISIPYPQLDLHIQNEGGQTEPTALLTWLRRAGPRKHKSIRRRRA